MTTEARTPDNNDKLPEPITLMGDSPRGDAPAVGPTEVVLMRSGTQATNDQSLWIAIRNRTEAISFGRYAAFMQRVLCRKPEKDEPSEDDAGRRPLRAFGAPSIQERLEDMASRPTLQGVDAYQLVKLATYAFLAFEGGVTIGYRRHDETGKLELHSVEDDQEIPGEAPRLGRPVTYGEAREKLQQYLAERVGTVGGSALPYLKRIVDALPIPPAGRDSDGLCGPMLHGRVTQPALLELIWSYWMEEGGLVQTMNAIAMRFQNRRRGRQDPLANLTLAPLRPVSNLLWGFVQDEHNRLSVARRSNEYDCEYGITLQGKAVPETLAADRRADFVQAFHTLLHEAVLFYREDKNTTVVSDGFSLLQALKQVHLVLAHGAHNQFGDLPTTARAEMLIMQWLLAQPELREFLGGRPMVPYAEAWMPQADTMARLQNWSDSSISQFRDLAVFSERIVLSVRYGDWSVAQDQEQARNWARYFKPEIQGYIHGYRAVTGVDLAQDAVDVSYATERNLSPSIHLQARIAARRRLGVTPRAFERTGALPALNEAPRAGRGSQR